MEEKEQTEAELARWREIKSQAERDIEKAEFEIERLEDQLSFYEEL